MWKTNLLVIGVNHEASNIHLWYSIKLLLFPPNNEYGGVKDAVKEKLEPERGKVGLSILFLEKFVTNEAETDCPSGYPY